MYIDYNVSHLLFVVVAVAMYTFSFFLSFLQVFFRQWWSRSDFF